MASFVPDANQQKIIDFQGGYALVLAAPGCGKTELLSHRVLKAYRDYGVDYSDMLCVTFTNRAAREMKERIGQTIGAKPKGLYVGNLHRFCNRFLYENHIIPLDTGLMDETDQEDFITELCESYTPSPTQIQSVLTTATGLREQRLGVPEELRSHAIVPGCAAMAKEYLKYLEDNKLIDYDDMLLLTYDALRRMSPQSPYRHSNYRWVQVDEVQDLNPLQFAILGQLTEPGATVVYLGDERQAIYSFLGAKHDCIAAIAAKSRGNIMHLSNNYRSPMYLLDMLNDYAKEVIGIDADRLPMTTNRTHLDDALTCVRCDTSEAQSAVIAALTRQIYADAPGESVGILVRTNRDAEEISEALHCHKISHLKITNRDMFKMVPFKTLHSHFAVVAQDTSFSAWGRILYQTHVVDKLADSRRIVREMRALALSPRDLMDYSDSSYVAEFCAAIATREVVVFDTETTGLDIFNDDIIQIAACKLRGGEIVPGSEIDIVIQTDKSIPATLGEGLINPMVEEYMLRSEGLRRHEHEYFMTASEAFAYFVDYASGCDLLGHNANFDVQMLAHNIARRTGTRFESPATWDTLLLTRLLDPNLRNHTLAGLLEFYGLEGTNSHNAIDDVMATATLAKYCFSACAPLIDKQIAYLAKPEIKAVGKRLLRNYLPLYRHTRDKLYAAEVCDENTFDFEFSYIYEAMTARKFINEIPLFDYMRRLFRQVVITEDDKYFNHQLTRHLFELRTFNEGDLYENGIIKENIHIMTIHKAKGLQFDTVFVHDASYGTFPRVWLRGDRVKVAEDARVLYVGMSRARKRVFVTFKRNITSFIADHDRVKEHFYFMPATQRDRILRMEEVFVKFL